MFFIYGFIALFLLIIVIPRVAVKGLELILEEEPEPIEVKSINIKNKKFIFRPTNLKEYIGQEKAKNLVKLNVKKINTLRPVHFLINGKKGCGKSTLAYLIAKLLNAHVIERISSSIQSKEDIYNIINEINSIQGKYVVLFLDEIHNLARVASIAELFYPVMEDFKLDGKPIRPFSIIGATTEKNMLVTKLAPLVDRFQAPIELENYNEKELEMIIKQYKDQLYPNEYVEDYILEIISKNCKYTPRIAITLLEDYLVEKDIQLILEYHRIRKDGLTDTDFKILETLNENDKPIGEKALSQMTGLNTKDFAEVYEPYLIERGYIMRTPRGRVISQKGKEIL